MLPGSSQTPSSISAKPPLVSLGLPVFNGADYLAEAIESILNQSLADFELILCDNASSDQTESICRSFAERDARVRYIRQARNLGAAANYNLAFEEARGTFFKWCAHDDNLAPDFLKVCVSALEANPDCVLAYTETTLIDERGRETARHVDQFASQRRDPSERLQTWLGRPTGLCNPVFGLIRREVMAKTIRHGTYMGADRILLGELALRGPSKMIPKPLFLRRMHPKMSTLAHGDAVGLTQWFTGKARSGLFFKRWRQLRGFLGVVMRVETLTGRDRWRAFLVVMRWAIALRGEFLKELMLPLYINGRDTPLKAWMRRLGKYAHARSTERRAPS